MATVAGHPPRGGKMETSAGDSVEAWCGASHKSRHGHYAIAGASNVMYATAKANAVASCLGGALDERSTRNDRTQDNMIKAIAAKMSNNQLHAQAT